VLQSGGFGPHRQQRHGFQRRRAHSARTASGSSRSVTRGTWTGWRRRGCRAGK